MNVKYAIETLKKHIPEQQIVIAYWTKQWFEELLEEEITEEQWDVIVAECESMLEEINIGDRLMEIAVIATRETWENNNE